MGMLLVLQVYDYDQKYLTRRNVDLLMVGATDERSGDQSYYNSTSGRNVREEFILKAP